MPVFSAPAWMMKGKGAGAATLATMSDADPYEAGKKKVAFRLSDAKLSVTNGSRFVVSFKIVESGFSSSNAQFRLEFLIGNHWRYTSVLGTFNVANVGSTQSLNISSQINGNASIREALLQHSDCYGLFETNDEICNDQVHINIVRN